jgi:hypothetical protein
LPPDLAYDPVAEDMVDLRNQVGEIAVDAVIVTNLYAASPPAL